MKNKSVGPIVRLYGLVGLLNRLLIFEAKGWKSSAVKGFKFVMFCFFLSQMYVISELSDQFPADTLNVIFSNIHEPVAIFCLLVMLMLGALFAVYTVEAAKMLKSLAG